MGRMATMRIAALRRWLLIAAALAVAVGLIYFNVTHATSPRTAVITSVASILGAATAGTAGYVLGRLIQGRNPE